MAARQRLWLVCAAAFACSDAEPRFSTDEPVVVPPLPWIMQRFGGQGQIGLAGSALADSIIVRVIATTGTPVPGVSVRFVTSTPGAVVDPATVITRPDGTARASWKLGPDPGAQTAIASVDQIPNPVTFDAMALPLPGAGRLRLGDSRNDLAGEHVRLYSPRSGGVVR